MYDNNPDEGPQPSDDLGLSLNEVTSLIQAGNWYKDYNLNFRIWKFREDLFSALEKLMADKACREETLHHIVPYPERYDEVD